MTQYRSRITIILVLLLSAFSVHTVTTAEGQTTQDKMHLRLASSKPIASVDPADGDPALVTQLFAGLTEIDPETFEPKPSLARSWEVSEDGTVYTFFLRKDIRWSNGTPITSHDFVATLHKYLDGFEAPKDLLLLKNVQSLFDGELEDKSLLGFQALDDHILQFTLEHPAPLFPVIVSFLHYRPVPVQVIEAKGKEAWTHPKNIVVSGPYTLQRWRKKKVLILAKNPAYFDAAKVKIAKISYAILPSSKFALKMYEENALDIIPVSKRYQISAIRNMLSIREQLAEKPLLETWYLGFNQSRPPVDQPLVRKAIAMAIDKEFLLKKILRLMGHPSNTFTAPPSFGAVDVDSKAEEIGIPFNPEQGQQRLFEAGYHNKTLPKIYISGPADVVLKPLKLMLERNLPIKIGLYGEDEEAGDPEDAHIFLSFKQAVYPDAHYFLSEFDPASNANKLHWNNENYTDLLNKAFRQHDVKQRKELYQAAEHILCQEEIAVIPLFYREIAFLTTPQLQWTYSPTGTQQLWTWSFTAN